LFLFDERRYVTFKRYRGPELGGCGDVEVVDDGGFGGGVSFEDGDGGSVRDEILMTSVSICGSASERRDEGRGAYPFTK
jgi:hypothetical protein